MNCLTMMWWLVPLNLFEAREQFSLDPFGVDSALLEFLLFEDCRMKTRRSLDASNS